MSYLTQFLEGPGASEPYRLLIQHHIRTQKLSAIVQAMNVEYAKIPLTNLECMEFIDKVNNSLGYDHNFWQTKSCKDALEIIIKIAIENLSLNFKSLNEAFLNENHETVFSIFQTVTLSFAYSAHLTKNQRKFMRIRKNLFFR